ncbi:long-chain-fatty-acid--CoA ligase [Halocalculus aciditolerans]|uniref:Long-chain-fatty-acid--CoA ligase n=1 Tax=Halocalculus aciditolerans TaxID=1383812 RepID=A0A830FL78_9EURY|nr:long-chain-fatty-acid--CoA ligase [Halocalculus aciditolerans]GGL66793.1 long-chain-fatty-acid--CoA ligase [Halocalculus aciditolerans]
MPGGSDMTLHQFLWRGENVFGDQEIISRTHDGIHRYTYSEYADRVRKLASALDEWGVEEGDRVATFAWNHHWHHETYFGVPCLGAQLHMINILLPDSHIQHIVEDAEDVLLFVDATMVEKLDAAYDEEAFDSVKQFVVMGDEVPDTDLDPVTDYESFIESGDPDFEFPEVSEDQPAGMCYTSGTTGKPKGVEYTHKMYWGHTMSIMTGELGLMNTDTELTIVPMFHVSGWGRPFATVASGATQVLPGPHPEPADIASLVENEGVNKTAGVPTVWRGLLQYAREADPDLSSLEYVMSGGSAAPPKLIDDYREELDAELVVGYGMTETSPVTHVAEHRTDTRDYEGDDLTELRAHAGLPSPGVMMKVIGDDGEEVPWDGESLGELLMKGPWVTTEYFNAPEKTKSSVTDDGWLRTGDIVRVTEDGYVDVVDRVDDLVKSGGEWISSVEVENRLMGHPRVAEAAVIPVDHPQWDERPVAFVVVDGDFDEDELREELKAYVAEEYPKWWAPDAIRFIDEVPKGSTGKFSKKTLVDEFIDDELKREVSESAPGSR